MGILTFLYKKLSVFAIIRMIDHDEHVFECSRLLIQIPTDAVLVASLQ